LEGEDDERLLSVWAAKLGKSDVYQSFYPFMLGGSTKREMQEKADRHYRALRQIVPNVKRCILLDYDSDEVAINPATDNVFLNEWKRKNIDNYLLVPTSWKRAVSKEISQPLDGLFMQPYINLIDNYFGDENLTLPLGASWREVNANIFKVLDGKKLLFENSDSLFERIKNHSQGVLKINRVSLATNMEVSEVHIDIEKFFSNLEAIVTS